MKKLIRVFFLVTIILVFVSCNKDGGESRLSEITTTPMAQTSMSVTSDYAESTSPPITQAGGIPQVVASIPETTTGEQSKETEYEKTQQNTGDFSESNIVELERQIETSTSEQKSGNGKIVFYSYIIYVNETNIYQDKVSDRYISAAMGRHPGRCIFEKFEGNYKTDPEAFINYGLTLVEDPEVKVFVMTYDVPCTEGLFEKISIIRPDILLISIGSWGVSSNLKRVADIVLTFDELGMIKKQVHQAYKMGTETFVYYQSDRRNVPAEFENKKENTLMEECSILGIDYIYRESVLHEAEGPRGRVYQDITRYGDNTCIYYSDFDTLETARYSLYKNCVYLQQGDVFHLFSSYLELLGIKIDDNNIEDLEWINAQIREKIAERGLSGRFALLPAPFAMIAIAASAEYGTRYCDGEITQKVDADVLQECFDKTFELYGFADLEVKITQDADYASHFLYSSDYVVY